MKMVKNSTKIEKMWPKKAPNACQTLKPRFSWDFAHCQNCDPKRVEGAPEIWIGSLEKKLELLTVF